MENFNLYKDIAERTNGDIYVGVVGPVRAGKSTFISKFMEALVLPNMENKHVRERAVDEMPQAAAGKTIMTTQPKFIPNEAATITLKDGVKVQVRMVDCVGYLIEGAQGHKEGNKPRLVKTPWSDAEMPFEQAAETGTKKVITDHSTIGIVITTDGSIATEIARNAYVKAEERVVNELKLLGKPFVVVLNTMKPDADETTKLKNSLSEKYGVPVLPIDVLKLDMQGINSLLETVLFEFPLQKVEFEMPKWMRALPYDNRIITAISDEILSFSESIGKMCDYPAGEYLFEDSEYVCNPKIVEVKLGEGKIVYSLEAKEGLFYTVLSDQCGLNIEDDFHLMSYLKHLGHAKLEYDKIKKALDEVAENGYGVVVPTLEEMSLEEPELVKQGSRFGVRLKASAPSLHIMRVDIETEISPIVGTEQQSEDLVKYLLSEFETDPKGIWETNMFGKSLHMLVKEGLSTKLSGMPGDTQRKMRKTLQRIINEGKGGVICILL